MEAKNSNWKTPCYEKLQELIKKRFSASDNQIQIGLIEDTMSHELYNAVRNNKNDVNNFLDVLEQVCREKQIDCSTVLHQATPTGDSLLHVVAEYGRERIAELLVDNNFSLVVTNNRKDTAIHVAARAKNIEVMRFILSKFDDASSKDDFIMLPNKLGRRALHEAILSKYLEGLNFLLSEKSESTWPLYWDTHPAESPIYVAVQMRDVRILHRLLQIPFPSGRVIHKSRGNSPIHAAISESNIGMYMCVMPNSLIKAFLKNIVHEKEGLMYFRDEHRNTPLHYAAYIGYVEGVRELLNKSNLVAFQRNSNGDLPIHIAFQSSRVQVVKQLLRVECPYTRFWLNNKGQNILHIAAENRQNKMVRFLLKHSNIHPENVNEKDLDGDAPLHLASRKLYLWTLLHLSRDKRTDANLVNDKGLNARDIVLMQAKHPMTRQEFRASMILRTASVPLRKDMLGVQRIANAEWNVKDAANTLILVAVLIATVTFAAGFTVPGGFYSSDDPVPKNRGMAVLADKKLFKVFMAFNTISMYSSIFSSIILLWMHLGDRRYAIRAYFLARLFVHLALGTMPVAFMAAIHLVVGNNASLGDLVKVISFIFISFILLLLVLGYFPPGNRIPLLRQIGELIFLIGLILFYGPADRPYEARDVDQLNPVYGSSWCR